MDPLSSMASAGVGGVLGFLGQSSANKANAQEAEKNRNFQERMSSTAHQREVEDLKAAGLNPMLSGMGGSGASGASGSQAQMGNTLEGAASSARDAYSNYLATGAQKADLELKEAQTEATRTNTEWGVSSAKSTQQLQEAQKRSWDADTVGKNLGNAQTQGAQQDAIEAARLNARLMKRQTQSDLKYQDMDNFNRRTKETLGNVNSAVEVFKPKVKIGGYDESSIHPGTGEVYKERQVRYKK